MKIGIISDIHEDITRLEECLGILRAKDVKQIICLGDSIGFAAPYYSYIKTRDANKVIETLKDASDVILAGNHDLFAIRKTPANIKGFDFPEDWYDLDYPTRKKLSDAAEGGGVWLYENDELSPLISDGNRDYIESLPEYAIKDYGNYKILFSHYAFPDPTGSLRWEAVEPKQLAEHFAFMKQHNCLYAFSGHDHFEGIKIFSNDFVEEIPFGGKYTLPDAPAWLHIPTVSNGTFKNGFAIYDAESKEIEAIPLGTPPHIKI